MCFQEEEEEGEVSSGRGEEERELGGELTWGVGTGPLCSPPSPREKMQSQNRDRLADPGENQPHRPEPWPLGIKSAPNTGFLAFSSDSVSEPALKVI